MTREKLRMLDLPWELVEEILSKVPATSLRRLQCTCKRLNALFKDPKFIKKHLDKAAKQNMVLMLNKSRIYSMNVNLHRIHNDVVDPSTLLSLNDFHNSEQVEILKIFLCEGLLLCTTRDLKLVVWNPCTGQTRWIQYSDRYKIKSEFSLGYVNNKSCPSYKILRYMSWDLPYPYERVTEYEIYDFSSDSWSDLRAFTLCNCYMQSNSVSLKGNTYWIAWDHEQHLKNLLLSFDFSTEKFTCMCLAFPNFQAKALSVVREEKLSVLCTGINNNLQKIEIWMTTDDKIDQTKVLSWRKFLSLDIAENFYPRRFFSTKTTFFIDEEKKAAVLCDLSYGWKTNWDMVYIVGEDNVYIKIPSGIYQYHAWEPFICNYVPSIVRIQHT